MGANRTWRLAHPTTGEMTTVALQSIITNLTCGDDHVAENAVNEITALGETALPTLFNLLDSTDPNIRWWVLRALADIPHPTVPAQLHGCLDDPDPEVRQCAALGLSRQPYPDAIPDLVKTLDDRDRLLTRLAGDSLIAIGSMALPPLIETLKKGSPSAQIEAARSLALIADSQAIPALFDAWQEGSTLIRYWAEEGFDRMGLGMQFFRPD